MKRLYFLNRIKTLFQSHPIVALLGPRQCGKTTLAKEYATKKNCHLFDLENPTDLARLESPKLALQDLQGTIIIDEIQRKPELFPVLRVLADNKSKKQKFLILGSASRDLIQQSSESLAGRIAYQELPPFSLFETGNSKRLWLRGGFPRSYLAKTNLNSEEWRKSYITTYLERDIPLLGIQIPAHSLRRFWMMLAHYHGQIFNSSEIGRSLGISDTTARRYLDILEGTFMIRQLNPWMENLKKRQVKSPKVYFRDSGIFHSLLGTTSEQGLHHHPKLGASWEGFALETVIRFYNASPQETFFWATHNEAELDLYLLYKGKRLGFEFKFTDSPKVSKSMRIAMEDLKLDQVTVVFPGNQDFALDKNIAATGLECFASSPKEQKTFMN